MSAGPFTRQVYELSEENGGETASIRVQPETITPWNPSAAGEPALPTVATASTGNRRRHGIHARYVTLRWTAAAPDGYLQNGTLRVPVLTPAAFAALTIGSEVTYLGQTAEIIGRNPERVR